MMKTKLIFILTFLLLPLHALAESDTPENVALGVAQSWLALVDAGDYAGSWNNASAVFQNTVDKQQWEKLAKDMRQVGPVVERSLKSATHTTSIPNAPKGEYVVILFDSEFSKKKSVTEKVIPMLGEDGKWRVGGYYIE